MDVAPYLEFKDEKLYNITEDVKVCDNMSLVIMIKCSDGIVCGADSRSTLNDGNTIKSAGNVCKVFSNDNIIVGTFGINQITVPTQYTSQFIKMALKSKEKIENVIGRIINNSIDRDEFLGEFQKQLVDDVNTFEFFIGYKENTEYKIDYVKINRNNCECTEIELNIIMCNSNFSYNEPKINRQITVDVGCEVVRDMIEFTEKLQEKVLQYQTVAGDVIIKVLK